MPTPAEQTPVHETPTLAGPPPVHETPMLTLGEQIPVHETPMLVLTGQAPQQRKVLGQRLAGRVLPRGELARMLAGQVAVCEVAHDHAG